MSSCTTSRHNPLPIEVRHANRYNAWLQTHLWSDQIAQLMVAQPDLPQAEWRRSTEPHERGVDLRGPRDNALARAPGAAARLGARRPRPGHSPQPPRPAHGRLGRRPRLAGQGGGGPDQRSPAAHRSRPRRTSRRRGLVGVAPDTDCVFHAMVGLIGLKQDAELRLRVVLETASASTPRCSRSQDRARHGLRAGAGAADGHDAGAQRAARG